jgi:hypothetical protein
MPIQQVAECAVLALRTSPNIERVDSYVAYDLKKQPYPVIVAVIRNEELEPQRVEFAINSEPAPDGFYYYDFPPIFVGLPAVVETLHSRCRAEGNIVIR